MTRRDVLKAVMAAVVSVPASAGRAVVSTLIGTGAPGFSDSQVANPYGLAIAPDGALCFCDLDNQRIRRLDLKTGRTTTLAGNGKRGYSGDGGASTEASLNMPHEIQFDGYGHLYVAERDNHIVRRIEAGSGRISTLAGTGAAGYSGDGGPASVAQLRGPHSIALEPGGLGLLICDVGNHRIRRVELATGRIETWGGTGVAAATPDDAPLAGTPLNGPRTLAFDAGGDLYLALREGNAIVRIDRTKTVHRVAGTGEPGYSGDGGPATLARLNGPKGLAWSPGALYVADTENHVIRRIDLEAGVIDTVLGTGQRGDGPGPDPRRCALNRPHGVLVDARGVLYVGDSESHRIRVMPVPGGSLV